MMEGAPLRKQAPDLIGPCIVPPRALEATGYGRVSVGDRNYSAHRLAWEIAHGPIPHGLTVDHLCVNPPCVNVLHMELVTAVENVARGWKRGSHVAPLVCQRGHSDWEWDPAGYRRCRPCYRARCERQNAARRAGRGRP